MRMSSAVGCSLMLLASIEAGAIADVVVDFEDRNLPANSFVNDAGAGPNGRFVTGPASFNNRYSPSFGGIWSGWALSSRTDGSTPGFTNQYSARPGIGSGGSSTYGIAYTFGGNTDPDHPSGSFVDLPEGASPISIDVVNTTYAYFAIRDGDPFSRKFAAGDFFLLDVQGWSGPAGTGSLVGTVDFALADFRGGASSIVDQWTTVDLAPLAAARSLVFGLRSSDVHPTFGMNTPAYFAADNLRISAVPEPASIVLLALGAVVVASARRRRSR
ncbi:MAG: DUF4465 domain-containing protein [Isosphaeraceae bacterium]|nr:DUF4465 domain-containing protein [Isosphaeraceae bacterium]